MVRRKALSQEDLLEIRSELSKDLEGMTKIATYGVLGGGEGSLRWVTKNDNDT